MRERREQALDLPWTLERAAQSPIVTLEFIGVYTLARERLPKRSRVVLQVQTLGAPTREVELARYKVKDWRELPPNVFEKGVPVVWVHPDIEEKL